MTSVGGDRGRAVARARELVDEVLGHVQRVEVLDRSYTIAASAFVALLPLILLITGVFTDDAGESPLAGRLIANLGLDGAAAGAVRLLLSGGTPGLYPLGLVIILYSAFSLSRRVGRAYSSIWQVPVLPIRQQWRGLAWVLLQVAVIWSVGALRGWATSYGVGMAVVAYLGATTCWFLSEAVAQWLLTLGRVPWSRLWVAAAFVAAARLGLAVWFVVYLSESLSRQAEQYGPIGVVFALFTGLFAVAAVMLIGTLLAAVVTAGWQPSAPSPDLPGDPDGSAASAAEPQPDPT